MDFLAIRHVLKHVLMTILQELRDIVEREALILGDLNPAAVLTLDALLATIDEILQEVDRNLLIGR